MQGFGPHLAMFKKHLFLAYGCLVGIPLVGLLGILSAGRRLKAPVSVAGAWDFQGDFSHWSGAPCGDLLVAKHPVNIPVHVVQSGKHLVFSFNDIPQGALSGAIDGVSLTAGTEQRRPVPEAAGCPGSQALRLTATVEREPGGERTLTGTMVLNTCGGCAPVAFRATRDTPPEREAP